MVVFRVPQTARAYFAKMSVRKSPDLAFWVCTQKDELPSLNGNLLSGGDGKCGKIPLWGRLVAAYALPEGYEGKKALSFWTLIAPANEVLPDYYLFSDGTIRRYGVL